jgi:[histone H3]-lysine36 N-trimethyltransferase
MGIFSSRAIKKDEELTFNYNVDRYGCVRKRVTLSLLGSDYILLIDDRRHDAQPCYCGEPKCVGFIGGKTQTEFAGMDDLCLDGMKLSFFSVA